MNLILMIHIEYTFSSSPINSVTRSVLEHIPLIAEKAEFPEMQKSRRGITESQSIQAVDFLEHRHPAFEHGWVS